MGKNVATRVLLLVVAVLAASLVGMAVGWINWATKQSTGEAVIAAGAAFGGALAVVILSYNFVMRRDE
ncbi:hypothetical protein OOJ91_30345 [Micromonospora lupini]|uniref:hypothetical protein n=1 Tax=Micromonospora lupini TaxID=285679 RepID=UPI002255175B|nr:hypothetical protein [Micromonospora lupini]MCX5070155.1 hypothetical protein [Micromonospora lupini]